MANVHTLLSQSVTVAPGLQPALQVPRAEDQTVHGFCTCSIS